MKKLIVEEATIMARLIETACDRFGKEYKMKKNRAMRAGFYAGAAIALAVMDAHKDTVEAVSEMAIKILKEGKAL